MNTLRKVAGWMLAGWGAIRGIVDLLESIKATRDYADALYHLRYLSFGLAPSTELTIAVLAVGGGLMFAEPIHKGGRALWRKIAPDEPALQESLALAPKGKVATAMPSLVFVFGAPLGDNDSATWVMTLNHYGPESAHNCNIGFYDDDRKNIEHEWLVKHPNSPYPPPGLAGPSQHLLHIAEASREGSAGHFLWNPLNPNSQHYTVSISCRAGVFVEKWEITRVNGILRSRITIEHGPQWIKNNPSLEPVIFRYEDPEFVKTALATEMPKSSTAKVVHPGWKPKHRFEVPAAILAPNGSIQILSGVKLPDGSTLTDFGSWNILTRHFGDAQDRSRQP
jgi:hypothetical protein